MEKEIKIKPFIALVFCLGMLIQVTGQNAAEIKKPAVGLHFFYNDFLTAYRIKTTSFGDVVKNRNWADFGDMQGGFGLDYLQGITRRLDVAGTFNASWVDYMKPDGTLFGSTHYLFDVNAGVHFRLLPDKSVISPFLSGKAGFTSLKDLRGMSLHPGVGLEFCFFKEAYILAMAEYRMAMGNKISNQMYYSIGIAAEIGKKKEKPKIIEIPPPLPKPVEPVIPDLDLIVTVRDEATGILLPNVGITISGPQGKQYSAATNPEGIAVFKSMSPAEYLVQGVLNNISTTNLTVKKESFSGVSDGIPVNLTHNDPRFTLAGKVLNKTRNTPEGGAEVEIKNLSLKGLILKQSREGDGVFSSQLEAASDFTVIGKKAGFISNIERVSTKGLNRSATLYVKLELMVEEAKVGQSIVLNNIYFETGKSVIKTEFSSDLEKLVRFLKDNPETKLEIQGHTDNTGSLTLNNRLSQQRAESVVKYLISNGIENDRLTAKGYGPLKPVADNNTETGRAKNRRVEMKVTK